MTGFTELGFYQDPASPGIPLKLKIKSGETRTGLNIHADWSNAEQAIWSTTRRGGRE